MVDAVDSKSTAREGVLVRVRLRAHLVFSMPTVGCFCRVDNSSWLGIE